MHAMFGHQPDSRPGGQPVDPDPLDAEQLDAELLDADVLAAVTEAFAVSAKTREVYPSIPNQHYGPAVEEYLDIYPATAADAPILVFLPGGCAGLPMLAQDFAGVARGPYAHGITTVIVNYAWGPDSTRSEAAAQVAAAIGWVYAQADRFGGDRERIVVAGHSVGGQLAVEATVTDWAGEHGLPADVVKGAVTISGRRFPTAPPIRWNQRGSALRPVPAPLIVVRGDRESDESQRETAGFLGEWAATGNTATRLDLPGEGQHGAYATYSDATSALTLSTVELIDSISPSGSAGLATLAGR